MIRRPPRGGVDRNPPRPFDCSAPNRSPPRGGVDKTSAPLCASGTLPVAPRAGAWIETSFDVDPVSEFRWSPPRGGVDRNMVAIHGLRQFAVSPPARGRGSKPLMQTQPFEKE